MRVARNGTALIASAPPPRPSRRPADAPTFLSTGEGTWRWLVSYGGDAKNAAITVACGVENFTITNK